MTERVLGQITWFLLTKKKKVLGQIIRVETSPYDRLSAYAGINLFFYST